MISASRTDALWACAYQFRPGLAMLRDEPSVGGLTGTLFHSMAEAHNDGRDVTELSLPGADETRAQRMFEQFAPWWSTYRHGTEWISEMPFAYSLTTGEGRRLPPMGQRNYSEAKPDEIPGTADAVALEQDRVVVVDYKTGSARYVTPANKSKQLLTLALAATRSYGVDRATVVIVTVSDLAPPNADEHEVDALDLDMFEDELRAKVAGIPTSAPVAGEHCRFCRHRHECPAAPAKYRNEGRRRVA